MRKILFASSEVHPFMKSGGLADVSASLPLALKEQGQDVRVIMPAYRQSLAAVSDAEVIAKVKVDGYHSPVTILQTSLSSSNVPLWLVDSPDHFDRAGGPYGNDEGDWQDNAARFALFSRVIVELAMDRAGIDWKPDLLHCNDWQTGLAPALLAEEQQRPKIIFTIHNLAYQGLFSRATFDVLDLPETLWHSEGIEFYDLLSFMKGGLVYADHVTTVSPTYAEEIRRYEYGYGLEGLLNQRAKRGELTGILNGIDNQEWNPETDPYIATPYATKTIKNKEQNKQALQRHFSLPEKQNTVIMGVISRLVSQKGIDLMLTAMTNLLQAGEAIQLICLGSGEQVFEQDLRVLRARHPDKVGLHLGYSESLAHRIEAGADVFLMPSRFEPCGLNQLYSLRYGTLPIVRNTGGLADSVVDANDDNRRAGIATGFKFEQSTVKALQEAMERAITLFKRPRVWRKMVLTAMEVDYSWQKSAKRYIQLYHEL